MTPKQKSLHAHLVKICHANKHNKFTDDEVRKDYLMSRFNVDSFKKLSIDQLREVSAFLGYAPPAYEPKMKSRKPTQKQVDTILGLWNEVSYTKSPLALREFIFKIVKVRPLHIANLNEQEARTMITVLLKMKEHKEANGD